MASKLLHFLPLSYFHNTIWRHLLQLVFPAIRIIDLHKYRFGTIFLLSRTNPIKELHDFPMWSSLVVDFAPH